MATAQLYSRENRGKSVMTKWGAVEFDKDGMGTLPNATEDDMTRLKALDWLATDEKIEELNAAKERNKKAAEQPEITVDPVKEALALQEPMYAAKLPSQAEPPAGTPRMFAVENPPLAATGETFRYAVEVPSEAEHNIEKKRDSQVKEAAIENAKTEKLEHEAQRVFGVNGGDPVDQAGELNKLAAKNQKLAAKRSKVEAEHEQELLDQAHGDESKEAKDAREEREYMAQQEEMEKSKLVTPDDQPKAESMMPKKDKSSKK